MSKFWVPRIELFGHFPEHARKVRNPEITKKSQKSQKSALSPELRFWALLGWFEGYPTWVADSFTPDTFGRFRTFGETLRKVPSKGIFGSEKCEKKCKNFAKFSGTGPQKNRKSELYAAGTTRRRWRRRAPVGPKKNALFRTFSRVKDPKSARAAGVGGFCD